MSRSRLIKYAWNSKIMEISISYGDDKFSFNLNSEILVDENRINEEIKEQPSAYSFLGMLHVKLERIKDDRKKEMEKAYSSTYIKYKSQINEQTQRPFSDDLAKEKAINSVKYQKAVLSYNKAKEDAGIIGHCVKAFEQRYALIQTLSANIRKTN